jgi:hydrogenase maturation protein HypF
LLAIISQRCSTFQSDEMRVLRRARGYSPEVLILPADFKVQPQILALGGELKNSFCLLKDGMAIFSRAC